MMKNCLLGGTIAIFACCSLIGLAQEGTKPATKTAQAEKPKGRLPPNYGKLGLTDKQKTSIYAIQAKYETQLDELEKQLDDLKAKRDTEVKTVLNDNQRKSLDDLLAEAKKKKEKEKADETDASKKDTPREEKK